MKSNHHTAEQRDAVRFLATSGSARLQVKCAVRRRPRRNRPAPQSASYPNHVWAYDFVEDYALDGRVLRILTVMDEFTRERLDIDKV